MFCGSGCAFFAFWTSYGFQQTLVRKYNSLAKRARFRHNSGTRRQVAYMTLTLRTDERCIILPKTSHGLQDNDGVHVRMSATKFSPSVVPVYVIGHENTSDVQVLMRPLEFEHHILI